MAASDLPKQAPPAPGVPAPVSTMTPTIAMFAIVPDHVGVTVIAVWAFGQSAHQISPVRLLALMLFNFAHVNVPTESVTPVTVILLPPAPKISSSFEFAGGLKAFDARLLPDVVVVTAGVLASAVSGGPASPPTPASVAVSSDAAVRLPVAPPVPASVAVIAAPVTGHTSHASATSTVIVSLAGDAPQIRTSRSL